MGFRFRKTFKAGPIRMTVSKSGIGVSAGVKGARITKPAKGKTRATVGIPGTGLSYSKTVGGKKKSAAKKTTVKKAAPTKKTAEKEQTHETRILTAEEIERNDNTLIKAGQCGFILLMVLFVWLTWFSFRTVFPMLAILMAMPIDAWQEILTDKLHMPLISKLSAGAAFALAAMFFTKPAMLALSGLLLVLAILLAIMARPTTEDDAAADGQADTNELMPAAAETAAADPTPTAEEPEEPETVVRYYHVAGVQFYLDNLLSMAEPNYLYNYKKQELIDDCRANQTIYKQEVKTDKWELVPEPDNPHDPNAIKVTIGDKLVGYIAAKDAQHVRFAMDNDLIVASYIEVKGGKYKMVDEDYNFERDKSTYKMVTGEDDYSILVTFREKVM